jgi:hypothetical protein
MESKHRYIQHHRRNVVTIHVYESRLFWRFLYNLPYYYRLLLLLYLPSFGMMFLFLVFKYRKHPYFPWKYSFESSKDFLFPHQNQMLHYVEDVIEFYYHIKESLTCIAINYFFHGYWLVVTYEVLSQTLDTHSSIPVII